jgi:hypothetical protein
MEIQRWQGWSDEGGLILALHADRLIAELICDATQRRTIRQCLLRDYFDETGDDGFAPLRDYVRRDLSSVMQFEVEAAVRAVLG